MSDERGRSVLEAMVGDDVMRDVVVVVGEEMEEL